MSLTLFTHDTIPSESKTLLRINLESKQKWTVDLTTADG